jgi:hypothetical protein
MVVIDVARVLVTGTLAVAVMAGTASPTMLSAAALLTGLGSMVRDTAASTASPRLGAVSAISGPWAGRDRQARK